MGARHTLRGARRRISIVRVAFGCIRYGIRGIPPRTDGIQRKKVLALKATTVVGIILIVIGIIGFAMGGISFTHEKKDVDVGPLQVSHKQTSTVPISPILSTVAVVVGAGLVVVGVRSR